MNSSSRDAGIPVLTEIIPAPGPVINERQEVASPATPGITLPAEPPLTTLQRIPTDQDIYEDAALLRLSEEDWHKLERRIRERILRQIFAKVDAVLEQRIRDSLADVLQLALEDLTSNIRSGLHQSLDDVISRAVSQEIARLQSTKK